MPQYRHIFFDLDRTLWDFEANSKEALKELYFEHKLDRFITTPERFTDKFKKINDVCWEQYRFGNISKENLRWERFFRTLHEFGYELEELSKRLGEEYVAISPQKKRLMPGALEILDYLKEKDYSMHIITNGFEDVQFIKMKQSGILSYFKTVTTSEMANAKKPQSEIFALALEKANSTKEEAIYVGDEPAVDVVGSLNFGIAAVWYNTLGKSYVEDDISKAIEINQLVELKNIL
ncbi:MAG: YjjG family noncanonical pyrimidine nucleotidase [Luteibaculaceae bacterium]